MKDEMAKIGHQTGDHKTRKGDDIFSLSFSPLSLQYLLLGVHFAIVFSTGCCSILNYTRLRTCVGVDGLYHNKNGHRLVQRFRDVREEAKIKLEANAKKDERTKATVSSLKRILLSSRFLSSEWSRELESKWMT